MSGMKITVEGTEEKFKEIKNWWRETDTGFCKIVVSDGCSGICEECFDAHFTRAEPPRWRAELGEKYWFINSVGEVEYRTENQHPTNSKRYEIGNYFRTEEEALAMTDKVIAVMWGEAPNDKNRM